MLLTTVPSSPTPSPATSPASASASTPARSPASHSRRAVSASSASASNASSSITSSSNAPTSSAAASSATPPRARASITNPNPNAPRTPIGTAPRTSISTSTVTGRATPTRSPTSPRTRIATRPSHNTATFAPRTSTAPWAVHANANANPRPTPTPTPMQNTTAPRFMYCNHEIVKRNHAITIDDVRDLVLHLVADAPPPNWLRVDNPNMIQKVVALLVPGLTPDILALPPLPTAATANPNLPLAIPLLSSTPTSASASTSTPASPNSTPASNGASPSTSPAQSIPFIASTFSHACPTRAPGDQTRMHSVLSTFFNGPVSGEEKKRRLTQRVQSESNKTDPTQYLLSLEQMIENDYPIPSYMADVFEKPEGWVETPQPSAPPPREKEGKGKQKIYAIDCEMCITENGKELTRVCVIDYTSGIVVYDRLVKPAKPILDYLTRWSGITAEQLAPVTTTLPQVQEHILRLLSPPVPKPNPFSTAASSSPSSPPPPAPTPILLGHSLESDLKALKLSHPYCIDTALLYHHPRGRPLKPGLAWLTKKWCGREIQMRGEGGHDPEEDARACVDLLKRKMEMGPGFGEFKVDWESIFERIGRVGEGGKLGQGGGQGIRTAVVDHGNPAVMHGSKATSAIGCKSDEEVLEGLLNVIPSHQFVFGRFMELANTLGWVTPKASPDQPLPSPSSTTTSTFPPPDPSTLHSTLSSLNAHLSKLHASLPPRTALIIFTGHSDPRRMSLLNARKNAFEGLLRTAGGAGVVGEVKRGHGVGVGVGVGGGTEGGEKEGEPRWTSADARDLEEAVELARRGLLFLGVKQ